VIAVGQVYRLQDVDIGVVFDHAAGVFGRVLDVDDDPVSLVLEIDLAIGAADQLLVLSDRAERLALESRRFDPLDLDPGDPGFGLADSER